MATFHQKFDNVKVSLSSLFRNRRRRSVNVVAAGQSTEEEKVISTPQNVTRLCHVTFDAGKKSFNGIPADWLPYFRDESMSALSQLPPHRSAHDSGVSMVTTTASAAECATPRGVKSIAEQNELLSLTYDRDSGAFVDLPPHWRERLERNNLLAPEFQKNPDLLVSVFALMDEELKAMSQEGFNLDRDMYSSSPATMPDSRNSFSHTTAQCRYVFEIEADQSNGSSEYDLHPDGGTKLASNSDIEGGGAPSDPDQSLSSSGGDLRDRPQTFCGSDLRQPSLVRLRAVQLPANLLMQDHDVS